MTPKNARNGFTLFVFMGFAQIYRPTRAYRLPNRASTVELNESDNNCTTFIYL